MRILIVEDEETLAQRVQSVLQSEGYQADVAFDGSTGLDKALSEEYDLMLLDILLPGINGIEVLQRIRDAGIATPVMMITAKDYVEDKVKGLDAGADDYLTKPFAIAELLARVRSLLRRSGDANSSLLKAGELEVNTATHDVALKGKAVELTKKEYSILEFLLYNKNRVLSRLSIAEHVWGDNFDFFSMTNFVDVHVKNLRKKLNDDKAKRLVQTVRGVGYIIKDSL